jgi:hypothetical protein
VRRNNPLHLLNTMIEIATGFALAMTDFFQAINILWYCSVRVDIALSSSYNSRKKGVIMSDLERQLTNPDFIADELSRLLNDGNNFIASTMEKHAHGESFADDENTAKVIIAKIREINEADTKRQLIATTINLENLVREIPLLIVENNRRLLMLFREPYQ